MSSFYLVAATRDQAPTVSQDFSEDRWPTLCIDPFSTALTTLVGHLTDRSTKDIRSTFEDLTPVPDGAEDAEPWDESFWVAGVERLPSDYVAAIAGITDEHVPEVVRWWLTVDDFEHYRQSDWCSETGLKELLTDIRNFLRAAGDTPVLLYSSP